MIDIFDSKPDCHTMFNARRGGGGGGARSGGGNLHFCYVAIIINVIYNYERDMNLKPLLKINGHIHMTCSSFDNYGPQRLPSRFF